MVKANIGSFKYYCEAIQERSLWNEQILRIFTFRHKEFSHEEYVPAVTRYYR